MLFLGVDQSLCSTGVALIREDGLRFSSRVIISRNLRDGARLDFIRRGVLATLAQATEPVAHACIEGGSFGSTHRGFDLGAIFGVLLAELYVAKIPTTIVPPAVLKKYTTGYGLASKIDMVNAVNTLMKLNFKETDDNEADACALAQVARALFLKPTAYHRHQAEALLTLTRAPKRASRLRTSKLVNI